MAAVPNPEIKSMLGQCEQIVRAHRLLDRYLNLRNELPDEMKLILWIDRLQIISMIASQGLHATIRPIDGMTDAEKLSVSNAQSSIDVGTDLIVGEFQSLCRHVHQIKNDIDQIKRDLNTVLEGPSYEAGHALMMDAKNRFDAMKNT